jgi:hypothetical protein
LPGKKEILKKEGQNQLVLGRKLKFHLNPFSKKLTINSIVVSKNNIYTLCKIIHSHQIIT